MPASTSPEPAVASQGASLMAIDVRPSGRAMVVSGPFNTTIAPLAAAAARTLSGFGAPRSSTVPKSSANSPSCGVNTTACADAAYRVEEVVRRVGEAGQRIGVEDHGAGRRLFSASRRPQGGIHQLAGYGPDTEARAPWRRRSFADPTGWRRAPRHPRRHGS